MEVSVEAWSDWSAWKKKEVLLCVREEEWVALVSGFSLVSLNCWHKCGE